MADPQTPNPADEAALDAATDALLDRVLGVGITEGFSKVQRTYWRANMAAARPHLTGPLEAEVARLRAELAELRGKVAKRHAQWRLYGECGHEHSEAEADVIWASEIGYVCEDGFERSICRECCTDAEDYQTEACAHDHATPCWPCETLADVAAGDLLPAVLAETPAPTAASEEQQ